MIDFAPSGVGNALARQSLLVWALAAASVLLCTWATTIAVGIVQEANSVNGQRFAVERKRAALLTKKQAAMPPPITDSQARAVNGAIAQLNLPWRDLFDALAATPRERIAILALEPNAARHVLKVLAEAKTGEDMVDFLRDLKRQTFFNDVNLVRHEVNEQDANKPVRFQFEAAFGPVSPANLTPRGESESGKIN